ncbi:MAG: sigma-70 family RNA polymerase sigma factor [Gemmatimonadaceae bacterium]|nr:sigma-70 family RNA polymerase sigma factor [Gemmatimonadaceae bacterium]
MTDDVAPDITELLHQLRDGHADSFERLVPLVYAELRRMAGRRLHGGEQTIGPTSLVHEVYLKLSHSPGFDATTRGHFFALAATAMRQIIVDRARAHLSQKRGGGQVPVSLDEAMVATDEQAGQAIALDDALRRLEQVDSRLRQVVECRFFAGLTEEQTADAIGVTSRTVRSDWVKARALLGSWLQD